MTLVLNDDDVMKLLPMSDCISVLEEAFADLGRGTTVNAPRRDNFLATSRRDGYYSFKSIEGGLERLGVFAQRINSDCVTYPERDGDRRRVKVPAAPGGRYGGWVTEGMHLTCITSAEFDEEAWRRSHLIIASSFPGDYQSRRSSSDLFESFYSDEHKNRIEQERNDRYAEKIHSLSNLLLGKAPGRTDPAQITLMSKRWGLGIEFASVGKLVYDRAKARGVGHELPTEWFSQTSHP